MEEGLEPLVRLAIYEAEATGRVFHSPNNDPQVTIFNPKSAGKYIGIVTRSNSPNLEERAISNEIRSKLKKEGVGAGKVNVLVMRAYKRAGPEGPYIVRATDRRAHEAPSFHLAPKEAIRSVRGNNVYSGMYISKGKQGDPHIMAYEPDGTRVNGSLVSSGEGTKEQTAEMDTILFEMKRELYLGDKVLVRKVRQAEKLAFFEPVINFTESDQATYDGQSLVTSVSGSSVGDRIFNLPILYRMQLGYTRKSMVGVGYLSLEDRGPNSYLFERVFVSGADREVGNYASQVRIDAITPKGIMAKKLRI